MHIVRTRMQLLPLAALLVLGFYLILSAVYTLQKHPLMKPDEP